MEEKDELGSNPQCACAAGAITRAAQCTLHAACWVSSDERSDIVALRNWHTTQVHQRDNAISGARNWYHSYLTERERGGCIPDNTCGVVAVRWVRSGTDLEPCNGGALR